MGGKRTAELIPLCHPLALTDLVVAITPDRAAGVLRIRAEAATTGPTGVEMEAMTAASVAALTVYDMVKGVERGVEIRGLRLVSKTGGKSGEWHRPARRADAGPRPKPRPGDRMRRADRQAKRRGALMPRSVGARPHRQRRSAAGLARGRVGRRARGRGWSRSGSPSSGGSCPTSAGRSRRRSSSGAAAHRLVVTTGGTGLTPRDVTPQATPAVLDYEVPGLAEAMRADGRRSTPLAALSRGLVGVRGGTLIVNVPGCPRGALESFEAVVPLLDHALETLAGPFDHAAARADGRADLPPGDPSEPEPDVFPAFADVPRTRWCSRCSGASAAFFALVMARHLRVFAARAQREPDRPPRRAPVGRCPLRDRSRRGCSATRGPGSCTRRSSGASCCSRSAPRTSSPAA